LKNVLFLTIFVLLFSKAFCDDSLTPTNNQVSVSAPNIVIQTVVTPIATQIIAAQLTSINTPVAVLVTADDHFQQAVALIKKNDFVNARIEVLKALNLKDDVADYWRVLAGVDEGLKAHYLENLIALRKFLSLAPATAKKDRVLERITFLINEIDLENKEGKQEESLPDVLTRYHQSGKLVFRLQGGVDVPLSSNFSSNFGMGLGGEGLLGFFVNDDLMLGVLSGFHNYNYQFNYTNFNYTFSTIPLELVAQLYLTNTHFRPYILLGAGTCFDVYTITSGTTGSLSYSDLLVEPGFGFSYSFSENFNIFAQTKLTVDFTTNNYFQTTTELYLPIQMGIDLCF